MEWTVVSIMVAFIIGVIVGALIALIWVDNTMFPNKWHNKPNKGHEKPQD